MSKMDALLRTLVFLVAATGCTESKTSFVKDQDMNAVFPPVNTRTSIDIPEGHLRPLGWQRKPDGKVREERDHVDPATFNQRYVKQARPVVLRGLVKDAPVLKAWEEDANLKTKYGKVNITITVKRELQKVIKNKRQMLFRKFLLDYMYENWYLSCTVPQEMMVELPLPDVVSCGTYKERLVETELWMSSGGTSSSLHSHSDHNIHCVIDGRKDFILIEGKHKDAFLYEETYPNSGAGSSPMDMDMLNVYRHKAIAETPWTWATLLQGDCMFVPAGYLHQVRSYGRGISYTVQFAPSVLFDPSECNKDETKGAEEKTKRKRKPRKTKNEEKLESKESTEDSKNIDEKKELSPLTLSDVKFVWAYTKGLRHLNDTKLEPASLRRLLFLLLKDGEHLYIEQFQHFYQEALHMDPEKPEADEVFHILTSDEKRTYLTREEITSLVTSRLVHVCEIFNKRHQRIHDEL